jgi:predicted ArsR family transcriptional regulator
MSVAVGRVCQVINVKTVYYVKNVRFQFPVLACLQVESPGQAKINGIGVRQQQLLTMLLRDKAGLTVEDLSQGLGITPNAVRQHLTALERDGLVAKGETQSSGGRPEQLYELTPAGNELFPRHYSWFAELLLDSLRTEKDSDALRERLESMGRAVARQVEARVARLEDMGDRIRVLAAIMHELGYESGPVDSPKEKFPAIEATNCVFHSLAQRFPEVCHFDLAMMSKVVGRDVIHDECMVRGGHVCRFKFKQR